MRYGGTKSGKQRREICRSFTCISPWFIFCRWFNGGKSRGSESRRVVERNLSRNYEASSSSREGVAAQVGKEASFNLGVGFVLICLIAARRNELKMVELHKQIETLLLNLQTEFQNQDKIKPVSKPSKSRISSSFSNNGVHENLYAEEHESGQYSSSHDVKGPEIGFGSNRYRREKSLRMDQIEAELEAEFDRLQVQMDAEFCLDCSEQQCSSEINVEESAAEWSHETGLEEVIEEQDFSYDEYYGVPPRELERKLHELLEERQQERISELESALEYAIEKLEQKEREVSWWTNAARLISQHFSAIIPSLVRLMKQDIHCAEPDFEVTERGKSLVIEELHI